MSPICSLGICHTKPCKLKCNSNLQWVIKYHAVEHILEQSTFCGYVIEYEFQNRIYTLRRNFIHHPSI